MATDFKRYTVHFDSTKGIVQSEPGFVTFDQNVVRAEAAISGFDISFSEADHHIYREMVTARVEGWQGPTVNFRVEFLLRDHSGEIDDPFEGNVQVLVIAELEESRPRAADLTARLATRIQPTT